MVFLLRKGRRKFRHLGYRQQVMPIVAKAMAEFLLRISVNSSYVVLGIYDIASESFYKNSAIDFLDQIPQHLAYLSDFSPYLKPFVSDNFRNIVYSSRHEFIIGSFYRYYISRLPVLVYHGRFVDWPRKIGGSEKDAREIAVHSTVRFEEEFPLLANKLMKGYPTEFDSIVYQYMEGKEMAYRYNLNNDKMRAFLYQNDKVWQDIIECFHLRSNSNIFPFVEAVFKGDFRRFWDSYFLDYMDTVRHWWYFGAFEGDYHRVHEYFWENLEKRLDRDRFILRAAQPY